MGKDAKKRVRKESVGLKKYGCLITLLIVVLLISAPFTLWYLLPKAKWRVQVISMTVPFKNYREHDAVHWILNNKKVPPPTNESDTWRLSKDYIGYYPAESDFNQGKFSYRRVSEADLANTDMVYITDTYGVYVDDYREPEELEMGHMDYSKLIFGGMNESEALLLEDFVRRGKVLIGEFNTFGSPTPLAARRRMECLFGVTWTEWSGRFFPELSDKTDVPAWAFRHWKWHYGEEWQHKGPGWLMTHQDTRLFVMKEGPDAYPMALRIKDLAEEDPLFKGVYSDVPFYYWFDVVEAHDEKTVIAKHYFHLKEPGIKLMKKFGLPLVFPFVIRPSKDPLRLYMAGDVTDAKAHRGPYYVLGLSWYKKVGRFAEHYRDQSAFFWQFFVPFMENIIDSPLPTVKHGNLPDFCPGWGYGDGGLDGDLGARNERGVPLYRSRFPIRPAFQDPSPPLQTPSAVQPATPGRKPLPGGAAKTIQ